MTIHLDTSALIGALTGTRESFDRLHGFIAERHCIQLSAVVLYEWLRGPRTASELRVQEELLPGAQAIQFGTEAAAQAAILYTQLPRARGRDLDIAIAACALVNDAALWTLNPGDFSDVPGLKLV